MKDFVDILQAIGIIAVAIGCIFNTMSINRLLNRNGSVNIYISLKREGESRTEESPGERQSQTAEEGGEPKC